MFCYNLRTCGKMQDSMYQGSDNYDTDQGSGSDVKSKKPAVNNHNRITVEVIRAGDVVKYTIPSFKVITVDLKHVVASVWDNEQDKISHLDMFLQNSPHIDTKVPCTLEILDSCYIRVLAMNVLSC